MNATTFRLDRGAALMMSGSCVMVAAVLVVAAFWLSSMTAGVLAALAGIVAGWYAVLPPVVLRLDDEGYRSRLQFSSGRFAGAWADIEDAELTEGLLVVSSESGQQAFPVRLVGRQRVQVLTTFSEHLNAAHGYRRWLG